MTERSGSALDFLHDEIDQLKRDGVFRMPRRARRGARAASCLRRS